MQRATKLLHVYEFVLLLSGSLTSCCYGGSTVAPNPGPVSRVFTGARTTCVYTFSPATTKHIGVRWLSLLRA
jgi:hypothetical protein